jgi:hypothetical protein
VLDQVGVERRNLLFRDLDLLQGGRDLLESQVAALAALRDQIAQLLVVGERLLLRSSLESLGSRIYWVYFTPSLGPTLTSATRPLEFGRGEV